MDSRHLVDHELITMLDTFPDMDYSLEALPQTRALASGLIDHVLATEPAFPTVTVSEHSIPGPQGAPDVRVLLYMPQNSSEPVPALLLMHGGGYVVGKPEQSDPDAKTIAATIGSAVVAVDYRLAPETQHPGPIEDCYAALKWLYTNAHELGVDASRIAVGGDSAGGGLAAGLALLARDRGEIPLVFQMLIYPMLDDRTATTPDPNPYAGEFLWTPEANRLGWTALLGQEPGGPDVSPYAAAARAENLAGLPSTWIGVGSIDLFVDENIEYARRLIRAGVPTELHVYPGAPHGFNAIPTARVTQAFELDLLSALTRALKQGVQS